VELEAKEYDDVEENEVDVKEDVERSGG